MARKKLVNTGQENDEAAGDESVVGVEAIAETMSVEEPSEAETVTQESETADDLDNVDEAETERQLKREKNALLKDVGKLGETYGSSKTCMISLAERVTEAAMTMAIGVKDAELIYDRFKERADLKATLDDNPLPVPDAAGNEKPASMSDEKSRTQQLSKLRSFIKLGNQYQDEGLDIVRRARNVHLRMLQGDRKAVKAGSTYTILVSVAGEQCKKEHKGVPMSDTDIEDYLSVTPAVKEPATAAKKVLDALVAAEAATRSTNGRQGVDSDNLRAAIGSLRATLGELEDGDRLLAEHEAKAKKKETEAAEAAAA